jgi:hypothetical protein
MIELFTFEFVCGLRINFRNSSVDVSEVLAEVINQIKDYHQVSELPPTYHLEW